jgi:hypothetical protein
MKSIKKKNSKSGKKGDSIEKIKNESWRITQMHDI